ncbi:hypothetical protein GCM10022409_31560 [Hymenobacter glaciei]|uniref:Carboxypeptidase regulatory-like domain-containing protein n=2 Tax=Hymenobacter glaciei TaxID=877209 RepID=A0ABP7UI05_9BACT
MALGAALTDENGRFVLTIPNTAHKYPKELIVESLLYQGRVALPADTTQRITLLVQRSSFRFKPYYCQRLADSVHFSPHAMPLLGIPGAQMAFLIQDSTAHQPRRLKTLTFRFGPNGFPQESFRVRIYQYNGPEQPPGEDLLTENCTVQDIHEGFLSFDISAYNVSLPPAGFFVSLEWMVTELRGITSQMQGYAPTGPILRPPCAFDDTRTWAYVFGKGWHRATAVENCWPLYESALSVEVEPAPNQPAGR